MKNFWKQQVRKTSEVKLEVADFRRTPGLLELGLHVMRSIPHAIFRGELDAIMELASVGR